MRAPILMLVAAMYAPSSSIRAQEPDLGLFESNYIVFANPTPNQIGAPSYYDEVGDGGNLITETQIISHFRWLRGLNRDVLAAGQSSWKVNAIATFQFRLRALQDASSPIRSPSYMPRLTGQLMKAYGGDPASPNAGRRNVVGFVGTVGHHSNGGDGCVIARHLHNAGWSVRMMITGDDSRMAPDMRANYRIVEAMGLARTIATDVAEQRALVDTIREDEVVVDALLGTGFGGEVRSPTAELIDALGQAPRRAIVAIDVPSGLDCDTGAPSNATIRADLTITFVAAKSGFSAESAAPYVGRVAVVDIGAPPEAVAEVLAEGP